AGPARLQLPALPASCAGLPLFPDQPGSRPDAAAATHIHARHAAGHHPGRLRLCQRRGQPGDHHVALRHRLTPRAGFVGTAGPVCADSGVLQQTDKETKLTWKPTTTRPTWPNSATSARMRPSWPINSLTTTG